MSDILKKYGLDKTPSQISTSSSSSSGSSGVQTDEKPPMLKMIIGLVVGLFVPWLFIGIILGVREIPTKNAFSSMIFSVFNMTIDEPIDVGYLILILNDILDSLGIDPIDPIKLTISVGHGYWLSFLAWGIAGLIVGTIFSDSFKSALIILGVCLGINFILYLIVVFLAPPPAEVIDPMTPSALYADFTVDSILLLLFQIVYRSLAIPSFLFFVIVGQWLSHKPKWAETSSVSRASSSVVSTVSATATPKKEGFFSRMKDKLSSDTSKTRKLEMSDRARLGAYWDDDEKKTSGDGWEDDEKL